MILLPVNDAGTKVLVSETDHEILVVLEDIEVLKGLLVEIGHVF